MRVSRILFFLFLAAGFSPAARADDGCHFVMNARLSTPLDSSDKKIAFRFTCREDMNLTAVSFYCEQVQNPPAYLATLHEDEKGFPAVQALVSSFVVPREGWVTVPVSDLPLRAGKVYHLVLEQDVNRGSIHPVGVIGPRNFAAIAYGDILNAFDPQTESPDSRLNTLACVKGQWRALDRQPLFALHGSGGKTQGDPYDQAGEMPVHGNGTPGDPSDDVMAGEAIHPHYGFVSTGFAVRVRRQGHPVSPLYYRVYIIDFMRHQTSLGFTGLALTPDQASPSFQWVTIGLKPQDHPLPFPPECRFLVFQTDSGRAQAGDPGCSDCYLISEVGNSGGLASAADLTFDGGPHLTREATSADNWIHWTDEFERDANVVILGPVNSNPSAGFPNPIPTPEPLAGENLP